MKINKIISKYSLAIKKAAYILIIPLLFFFIMNFAFAGNGLYYTTNNYVTQSPYDNLCWAASSVSMLQTKGINTNVVTHATKALGSFSNVGRARSLVANDFSKIYNINANLTGTLSPTIIVNNMILNKPIYAGVNWNNGGGHGVVISGIDTMANNGLQIMDPFYGWQYPNYHTFLTNYHSSGTWSQSICFN